MSTPDPEAYAKNTKAQYESIGRFVEAFELMVDEARNCCIRIIARDLDRDRALLTSIPLFHQAMSAKPIYDVFFATVIEFLSSERFQKLYSIDKNSIQKFKSVLSAINSEYEYLTSKRNSLLHGTWFVGYPDSDDPEAEFFRVQKFSVGGAGVNPITLPGTANEMDKLRKRCEEARMWISTIHGCLPIVLTSLTFDQCFRLVKNGKTETWERLWPSPHRFPPKHQ